MSFPKIMEKNKSSQKVEVYFQMTPAKSQMYEFSPKSSAKYFSGEKNVYLNENPKTLSAVKSMNDIKTSPKKIVEAEKVDLTSLSKLNLSKQTNSTNSKLISHFEDNLSFLENQNLLKDNTENGLRKFKQQFPEKFKKRVLKGPCESFRWLAWKVLSLSNKPRNEEFFNNLLNISLENSIETQIKKDLNRTLSDTFIIEKAQTSLYNVLKAYALIDKETSYCQGMNFIAGFLLIVSDFNESDTFYMLKSIFCEKFAGDSEGIRGFFVNNFPLLKLFTYQFDLYFSELLPNLHKHFKNLELPHELWVGKWFQTMFTIILPFEFLIRFWDCLFVKGLEFLFTFTISLLENFEGNLMKIGEIYEFSEFFKNMNTNFLNKNIHFDIEEIISKALKIRIDKEKMSKWKKEYEFKKISETKFLDRDLLFQITLNANKKYSNKKSHKRPSNINTENMDLFLKSNSSFYMTKILSTGNKEEESKKSTNHDDTVIQNDSLDEGIVKENSMLMEIQVFGKENKSLVNQNITTHTLKTKASVKVESKLLNSQCCYFCNFK